MKKLVSRTTCEGKLSAVLTPLYLARGTMQSRVEKQFFKGRRGEERIPLSAISWFIVQLPALFDILVGYQIVEKN